MKKIRILTIFLFLALFTGCVGTEYTFSNMEVPSKNKDLSFSITPTGKSISAGYSAFILEIENKTNRDMEIDWNRTNYVKNNSTNGTFMFEGILYKDRNAPKSNDVIFANSTFQKVIYPNNYVNFDSYGWSHYGTGSGVQGAYVTIIDDKKIIKEKVLVDIQEKTQN